MSKDANDLPKEQEENAEPLLVFPCEFPLKVVGINTPDFIDQILSIIKKYDPAFDPSKLKEKGSAKGNFLALSITVNMPSQKVLDSLYRELVDHPLTKFVL